MAGLKLLIIGGYGVFGGRIVELLEGRPDLTIVVAGRSAEKALDWIARRSSARARLVAARFDRNGDVAGQLAQLAPDIVIDASGPFQAYGDGRYRVIEACIAQRKHYLDLADGSEFVAGVAQFDAAAREAGVYVLSGVSSFPVLTAAVVRRLSRDMDAVEAIHAGIAPSPYAGVGENVIRAIASYAGQPVRLRRDGREAIGYPFTEQMRFTIAPGGKIPVRDTLFSLVDVPDLIALGQEWPQAKTIWMGAGPVPEILHRMLIGLSWLTRWRIAPRLTPLAPLMHMVMNRLAWGEHRGGMFVAVAGVSDGATVERSWHMLAEGDDGPLIPAMAVEAIIDKARAGRPPQPGARASVRDLELSDYEALFARRMIHAGERQDQADAPLYRRILADAWDSLPPEIRAMHNVGDRLTAKGRASVERGKGLLSRLAGWIIGFPPASDDTPVRVEFAVRDGGETWTRNFGGNVFHSDQLEGSGRWRRLLVERFGPMRFAMALEWSGDRLRLVMRDWTLFGVRLPLWFCPRSDSYETVEDGRFRFHVAISHPLTGPIVRYRGWLEPDPASEPTPKGPEPA